MRAKIPEQSHPFTALRGYPLAEQLTASDELLRRHPEWVEWVHADLTRGVSEKRGCPGLSAFLVLRVVVLKHVINVSLHKLAFLIADSLMLRAFLGLEPGAKAPPRSTLQTNVVRIQPQTFGRILKSFARSDEALEVETGEKVRVDPTVVKTNIHTPADSSLLWDCVRTLTRLMKRVRVFFPKVEFEDHSRSAKRLHTKIYWASKAVQRVLAYHALLEEAGKVSTEVARVRKTLRKVKVSDAPQQVLREELLQKLEHLQGLFTRVIDQTKRRVIQGEKVPADEKVYSIFETHTDMIKRGERAPEFGHKVTLTMGKHFVLDAVIEHGNPADVTLAVRQIKRQKKLYGRAPKVAVFDGGFTSEDNLKDVKALGVERCAFSKGRGLKPEEMAGSRRTYGRLKRFRAGIEGKISWLKRAFGLRRCTWKGRERFQSYVWSAIFAANLMELARLRLTKHPSQAQRPKAA